MMKKRTNKEFNKIRYVRVDDEKRRKKYVDRFFRSRAIRIASNLRKFLQRRHAFAVFSNREMNLFFRKIARLIDLFSGTCSCQLNGLSTRINSFLCRIAAHMIMWRKNVHAVRMVYTTFWRLIELDSGCWKPFLFLLVGFFIALCVRVQIMNNNRNVYRTQRNFFTIGLSRHIIPWFMGEFCAKRTSSSQLV